MHSHHLSTVNAVLEKVKTNSIGVTLPPLAQLENVLTSQSLALSGMADSPSPVPKRCIVFT
jgi:hypothetical protein